MHELSYETCTIFNEKVFSLEHNIPRTISAITITIQLFQRKAHPHMLQQFVFFKWKIKHFEGKCVILRLCAENVIMHFQYSSLCVILRTKMRPGEEIATRDITSFVYDTHFGLYFKSLHSICLSFYMCYTWIVRQLVLKFGEDWSIISYSCPYSSMLNFTSCPPTPTMLKSA